MKILALGLIGTVAFWGAFWLLGASLYYQPDVHRALNDYQHVDRYRR